MDEQWAPCYSPPGGEPGDGVDCTGQTDGTFLPVPDTGCLYFVMCWGEVVDLTNRCRDNQLFDPDLGTCVSDEDFTCPDGARWGIFDSIDSRLSIPKAKRKRHPYDIPF